MSYCGTRVIRCEVHGEMVTNYDCEFPRLLEYLLERELVNAKKCHVRIKDFYDWKGDPGEKAHFVLDLMNNFADEDDLEYFGHTTCLTYYIKIRPETAEEEKTIRCSLQINSYFPDIPTDGSCEMIYRGLADCCLEALEEYDDIYLK